jgi:hypothetical protein
MKKDKLSDLIPGIVLNAEELSNIVGGAAGERPETLCGVLKNIDGSEGLRL